MQKMPVPIRYPHNVRGNFAYPRTPPVVPQYEPPKFEKFDRPPSLGGNASFLRISHTVRNHIVAMIGEFIGTMLFLFFGFASAQIANTTPDDLNRFGPLSAPSLLQLLFISTGFGVGLALNVWTFYRVSGGMFNPAVTTALCLAGAVPWIRGVMLIPVQLVGGIVAAAIVGAIFPGQQIQFANGLGSSTSKWQGLVIEILLTAELVFTILMLAVEKHRATFLAPLGIGLALFAAHVLGVSTSGASFNPARSFGPAVVLGKFTTYHWIYWLGPFTGAIIAAGFHRLLLFLQYESANSGQDDDGLNIYRIISKRRHTNDSTSSLANLI